jgi:hypothetical protein
LVVVVGVMATALEPVVKSYPLYAEEGEEEGFFWGVRRA